MPDQSRWEWRFWGDCSRDPRVVGSRLSVCSNLPCLFLYLTERIGRGQEKKIRKQKLFSYLSPG